MGRPKSYSREEALDRAIDVFSRKGFESASVQDLVTATGVNRFSLYETFGDKHSLFLEALDRYHAKRRAYTQALLEQPGPKMPLIRRYFEAILEDSMSERRLGCLMINATVELARTDPETAKRAAQHFNLLEEIFLKALCEARDNGEILTRRNLRAVARFLLNNARGLRVVAKYADDPATFRDILDLAFSVVEEKQFADFLEFQNVHSGN